MTISPYLTLNIILGITWIFFFWKFTKLRIEMLIMSVVTGVFGIMQILFVRDYWHPVPQWPLGNGLDIDSIIWAFLFGGIAAIAYEGFFGKYYLSRKYQPHTTWGLIVGLVGFVLMIIGVLAFGLNTMYVGFFVLIIAGLSYLYKRPDLWRDALGSGIVMGILMVLWYELIYLQIYPDIFIEWWKIDNLSGWHLFRTPLEEVGFAFLWGFTAGPTYEFMNGLAATRKSNVKKDS